MISSRIISRKEFDRLNDYCEKNLQKTQDNPAIYKIELLLKIIAWGEMNFKHTIAISFKKSGPTALLTWQTNNRFPLNASCIFFILLSLILHNMHSSLYTLIGSVISALIFYLILQIPLKKEFELKLDHFRKFSGKEN